LGGRRSIIFHVVKGTYMGNLGGAHDEGVQDVVTRIIVGRVIIGHIEVIGNKLVRG
jgi:hypothetical protein